MLHSENKVLFNCFTQMLLFCYFGSLWLNQSKKSLVYFLMTSIFFLIFFYCHFLDLLYLQTRFWTATCPLPWSPHFLLLRLRWYLCLCYPRHPSSPPAACETASGWEVCRTPPPSRISWSFWENTPLISNHMGCTWSLTNRWERNFMKQETAGSF